MEKGVYKVNYHRSMAAKLVLIYICSAYFPHILAKTHEFYNFDTCEQKTWQ